MAWRSVIISNPAQLRLENRALVISQDAGVARVMLEDLSVLVLETPQAIVSTAVLSACMEAQVAVVTVDGRHMPNGILVPFQSHSRPLRVLKAQVSLGQPVRKRLWQRIVRTKIENQSSVLRRAGKLAESRKLEILVDRVGSGDPENVEARAAQSYFRHLFGKDFARHQERLVNAALDYGYAIFRAALARELASHGFVTALGLFHRNELNAYNLADDLLEPYRPLIDARVLDAFAGQEERELVSSDKGRIVGALHADVVLCRDGEPLGSRTVLSAMQATVASLSSVMVEGGDATDIQLPSLAHEAVAALDDDGEAA